MITSRLTSKCQTTVPQAVRVALRLAEGDEIAYQIDGARVVMTRAAAVPASEVAALLNSWATGRADLGAEDRAAVARVLRLVEGS